MKRIKLLGCPVDAFSVEETIEKIERHIISKTPCRHVVINVAKLVKANKSPAKNLGLAIWLK